MSVDIKMVPQPYNSIRLSVVSLGPTVNYTSERKVRYSLKIFIPPNFNNNN